MNKKISRLPAIIMSLVVLSGLLPMLSFSVSAQKTINHVAVTGVTPPVLGAMPTTKGIVTTTPFVSIDYSSDSTLWMEYSNGKWATKDTKKPFEAGKNYRIKVFFSAKGDYTFANNTTATVNGNNASSVVSYGPFLDVYWNFPPLGQQVKMTKQSSPWTQGSGKTASFTSNAEFADFTEVKVDGKKVSASDYEVKNGSTTVAFKAAFLETLAVGRHRVEIVSKSGTAVGSLEILAKPAPPETKPATPQPSESKPVDTKPAVTGTETAASETPESETLDATTAEADTDANDDSQIAEAGDIEKTTEQKTPGGALSAISITAILGIAAVVFIIIIILVAVTVVLLLKKKK